MSLFRVQFGNDTVYVLGESYADAERTWCGTTPHARPDAIHLCRATVLCATTEADEQPPPDVAIEDAGLSVRARRICVRAGIQTLRQLASWKQDDLEDLRNCGSGTMADFRDVLIKHGISPTTDWTVAPQKSVIYRRPVVLFSTVPQDYQGYHHQSPFEPEIRCDAAIRTYFRPYRWRRCINRRQSQDTLCRFHRKIANTNSLKQWEPVDNGS